MRIRGNPLFKPRVADPRVDATRLAESLHITGEERRMFIARFVRGETAKQALAPWNPPAGCFGFTKGQFSLVDLIEAILDKIGPARLDVSTWTAAVADVRQLDALLRSGRITGLRLLVDGSFAQRQPLILQTAIERFGQPSLRVCNNHAKYFLLTNEQAGVVCKTSMNLNFNPRFENFDLSCDPDLHAFLLRVMDDLWGQAGPLTKHGGMERFKTDLEATVEN